MELSAAVLLTQSVIAISKVHGQVGFTEAAGPQADGVRRVHDAAQPLGFQPGVQQSEELSDEGLVAQGRQGQHLQMSRTQFDEVVGGRCKLKVERIGPTDVLKEALSAIGTGIRVQSDGHLC